MSGHSHFQKHERICLGIVKELLEPRGYEISTRRSGPKLVIVAEKEWLTECYTIPSTPRCADNEICYVRQWANRMARKR